MSADTVVGSGSPQVTETARRIAALRRRRWYRQPRWTRLSGMLGTAYLVTLMLGPQGSTSDVSYALEQSFKAPGRLLFWVAVMLAVWAFVEFGGPVRDAGRPYFRRVESVAAVVGGVGRSWAANAWVRRGVGVAIAVVLVLVPEFLSRYWNQVLVSEVAIYVLLAIGLNVVVGWAGLLDLGFIAFFAIGAYSAAYWTGSLPAKPPFELTPFLIIPVAVVTCLVAGVLLGAPTLRLRGDYLAIVTLGFHEIVYLFAKNKEDFTNGPRGAVNIGRFDLFGYKWGLDPKPYWWLILVLAGILVFLFRRLEHSRVGRAWTAVREDEVAAAANGVDTVKYKLMAFAIGASTSGVAGVVYASKTDTISPEPFVLITSVLVLAYVVFGGMGSLWGVIVGTAFLAWLPQYMKDWVDARDRFMFLGAVLVVMMVYRPQGLIPSRRRKHELSLAKQGIGDADAMSEPVGGRVM